MHAAFSALSALVIAALWVDGRIVLHREVRALIAAANDLEQRQYPRPIHVDAAPLPGTFGERFVHAVPILVAEVKRGRDEVDRFLCTSVRDGSAPVTALTDECRDSIARAAEATRIAREATRAERADPPPGL